MESKPVRRVQADQRVLVFYCNTLIREHDLVLQGSASVEPCSTKDARLAPTDG